MTEIKNSNSCELKLHESSVDKFIVTPSKKDIELEISKSFNYMYLYIYHFNDKFKKYSKYFLNIESFLQGIYIDMSSFINIMNLSEQCVNKELLSDTNTKESIPKLIQIQHFILYKINKMLDYIYVSRKETLKTIILVENMNNNSIVLKHDNLESFDNIALYLESYDLYLLVNFERYLEKFEDVYKKYSKNIISIIEDI